MWIFDQSIRITVGRLGIKAYCFVRFVCVCQQYYVNSFRCNIDHIDNTTLQRGNLSRFDKGRFHNSQKSNLYED